MYEEKGPVNWTVLSMQGDKKETLADPGVGIAGRIWNNIYMLMQSVQCHEGKNEGNLHHNIISQLSNSTHIEGFWRQQRSIKAKLEITFE